MTVAREAMQLVQARRASRRKASGTADLLRRRWILDPAGCLVRCGPVRDLDQLGAWLADGSLPAVVDSRFALSESADAFRRLESRRARGKFVIEVARC